MRRTAILNSSADGKKPITPKDAAAWFLRDLGEVSGYAVAEWSKGKKLSAYATYRPVLTAPDPWYFAGVVALEACKICDLFEPEIANEILREVMSGLDAAAGRDDTSVSDLAFLLMGRLGMGAVLLHRRVPDELLSKVMIILLGSSSTAAPFMPEKWAYEQVRAALKLGRPVWWMMFKRRYDVKHAAAPVRSLLQPSSFQDDTAFGIAAE